MWSVVELYQTVEQGRMNRGELWFRNLITGSDVATAKKIVMLCDSIWFRRNQKLFQGKDVDYYILAVSTLANLENYHNANGWLERASNSLHVHALLCPPEGRDSVWFDAGITGHSAMIGVVVLAGDGTFVKAVARRINGVSCSRLAEGLALMEAITVAQEMDRRNAIYIGDSLEIVRMARQEIESALECFNLVEEVHALIEENGSELPYRMPEHRNLLAHSLANYAKTSVQDRII